MYRFEHIQYFYALAILPLLVALYILSRIRQKKKLTALGDARIISQQLVGYIPGRSALRFILVAVALSLCIVGWANLQKAGGPRAGQRRGVDVMLALDVSRSMLATDLTPNRLARAHQLIQLVLDRVKGHRTGLIVFAGRSYLQVPLTTDQAAVRMMLQTATPDLISQQGTVLSDAIDLAKESFSSQERKYKMLVLLTDGEDHDDRALAAAKEALDEGVIIHTIGIGSTQGTTLVDPANGSVKLDEAGNPVVSRLNEKELTDIAKAGNGSYLHLGNADAAADHIINAADNMESKGLGMVEYTDYQSYFQFFLLPAFLLLLIEPIIPGARSKPTA